MRQSLQVRHVEAIKEIERLRGVCAEAYQILSVVLRMEECDDIEWDDKDTERALDNLAAAKNGEPIPHDDLLPWPMGE